MEKRSFVLPAAALSVGALLLTGCGASAPDQTASVSSSSTSISSTTTQASVSKSSSAASSVASSGTTSGAASESASASRAPNSRSVSASAGASTKTVATKAPTASAAAKPSTTKAPSSSTASATKSARPTTTQAAGPKSIRGLEIYKIGQPVEFKDGSNSSDAVEAAFTITGIKRATTCPGDASIKPINGQFIILNISGWNELSQQTSPQPIWVHSGAWQFYPGGGSRAAIPSANTPLTSPCLKSQAITEFGAGQVPESAPKRGVVVLDVARGAGSITYSDMGVESVEYRVP